MKALGIIVTVAAVLVYAVGLLVGVSKNNGNVLAALVIAPLIVGDTILSLGTWSAESAIGALRSS